MSSTANNNNLAEFNLASNLPIKLNGTNYPTWHKQLMHLLTAHNLVGYVTGTTPCHPATIGTSADATPSPALEKWRRQDSHVSLALLASCSPEAQIIISSATSSAGAWAKLTKAYSNRSCACVMSLKERLASTSKGSLSVHEYLCNIRSIGDELALIGHPVDDLDLVIVALNGPGPTFREFTASIRTRDSPLQFDELFDKLVDFKIYLQREEHHNNPTPVTANAVHCGNHPATRHNHHHFNSSKSHLNENLNS